MTEDTAQSRIDRITIIGLALILLPLLTMWHEIGGHVATCLAVGGKPATIGAFYVDCTGVTGLPMRIVASAGIAIDTLLSVVAWQLWKRSHGSDLARLVLFYIWIVKGFVAAGYFLFSGISGYGDLGTDVGNGMEGIANPLLWRIVFVVIGGFAYWRLYVAATRALDTMLGRAASTNAARRRIAHLFYIVIGIDAVFVGLLNPVGIVITIMSATASSFGGNAGFISVGFAGASGPETETKPFEIGRSWPTLIAGLVISIAFALILGPSIHPMN
jgi:hypothetical protein